MTTKAEELDALNAALMAGKKWGNYTYEYENVERKYMSSAERKALNEKKKKSSNNFKSMMLNTAKAKNIDRKKKKHFNAKTKTLKRIAKTCKWECDGEVCWAHEQKMCPYIHKGEPGWNAKTAVKKGGARKLTRRKRSN